MIDDIMADGCNYALVFARGLKELVWRTVSISIARARRVF